MEWCHHSRRDLSLEMPVKSYPEMCFPKPLGISPPIKSITNIIHHIGDPSIKEQRRRISSLSRLHSFRN